MCLAGAVVESWSLTQEVVGLSPLTVTLTNIFVTECAQFSGNIWEKLHCQSKFNSSAREKNYALNIPIVHFDALKVGSGFEKERESVVAMINLILDNTT